MVSQTNHTPQKAPTIYDPIRRALLMAGYLPATEPRAVRHQRANTAPDPRAISPAKGRAP